MILDQFEERFLYASTAGTPSTTSSRRASSTARCPRTSSSPCARTPTRSSGSGSRAASRTSTATTCISTSSTRTPRAGRSSSPWRRSTGASPEDEAGWDIEPALVDAVLDEVRRGRVTIGEDAPAEARSGDGVRVETAYLQLVMQRIWDEESTAGSRLLRVETLRRLGGAGTIVRAHVDDALTGMPDAEQDAASEALRFLVTSGGRKIALSTKELREFTDVPAEPLESALERLERHRILRPVAASEPDGAVRRELYHDVLAPAVLDWRRRHVDERERQAADRKLAEARGRSRLLEVRNRRLAAAVIALAAAIVGLGLYLLDPAWLQRLDLRTVDARLAVQDGHAADPRVALIAVDDATLNRARGEQRPAPALRLRDHPRPGPARRPRRHGARRDLPAGRRPGRGSPAPVGHPQVRPEPGAAVRRREPAGAARGGRRPDRPGGPLRRDAAGHVPHRLRRAPRRPGRPHPAREPRRRHRTLGRRGHEHADVRVHRSRHRPGRRAARAAGGALGRVPAGGGRAERSHDLDRSRPSSRRERQRPPRSTCWTDGLPPARSATSSSSSA